MKKNLIYLLAGAAALLPVSCNKDMKNVNDSSSSNEPQLVSFKAGGAFEADVKTKASVVLDLDEGGFYASAVKTNLGTDESIWTSTLFTKTGNSFTGGRFWPHTNQEYSFYASNNALSFAAAGTSVTASNDKDVVCAYLPYAEGTYKTTNNLVFNHIFARIGTCSITAPAGYDISDLTVKITPKISGTYNIKTGTPEGAGWTSTSNGAETTLASALNSSANNDLYLIPGTYTLTANYTISKGSAGEYTETLTKTASIDIVGGKVNNISATLPDGNAQEIIFTVTVTPWGVNPINVTFS